MKTGDNLTQVTKISGPLKAFTNPDSQRNIQHFPAAPTDSPVLQRQSVSHRHLSDEKSKLVLPNSPQIKGISKGTDDRSNRMRFKDSEHFGLAKPTSVEAAMGPYKDGNTSNKTNLDFVPSPPPSGKPTTPRPSSAARFRKMVLECRE